MLNKYVKQILIITFQGKKFLRLTSNPVVVTGEDKEAEAGAHVPDADGLVPGAAG